MQKLQLGRALNARMTPLYLSWGISLILLQLGRALNARMTMMHRQERRCNILLQLGRALNARMTALTLGVGLLTVASFNWAER